ncbi:Allantoicase [Coemansia sp. RSA 2336]|nr:Allantoicase [Coemansia sp. RSA 2336]
MGNVQSSLPTYYNADPTNEAYTHSLSNYVDLASSAIGAKIVKASNERFGSAANLIRPEPPKKKKGLDAWVTRRHNPEADWAVVELGSAGTIAGFDIDTRGLDGEHASQVSIQGCLAPAGSRVNGNGDIDGVEWEELLPQVDISGNSRHLLALWTATKTPYSHVRLVLHPDGGVSRLRILGTVVASPQAAGEIDLACVTAGARVVKASDEKLGAKENLILPSRATTDCASTQGWKTRRSRTQDHSDWAIVRLGEPGFLTRIELDTQTFNGDQPVSASVQACFTDLDDPERDSECFWYQIVPRIELNGNKLHKVDVTLNDVPFSHIKLVIHPDGGVSRLRAFGQRVEEIEKEAAREKAEAAEEAALAEELGLDSSEPTTDTESKAAVEAPSETPVETKETPSKTPVKTKGTPSKAPAAKGTPSKAPATKGTPSKAPAAKAPAEPNADKLDAKKPRKPKQERKKRHAEGTKKEKEQFSSQSGEIIQSLTSPLPSKKRTRARSHVDDDTDNASVDSQAKRSRRKPKTRTTAQP